MEMRFPDSWPPMPGDSRQGLRPLGWSELCARLVAAHDTRGVLPGASAASAMARGAGSNGGLSGPHGGQGSSFHEPAAVLLRCVETDAEGLVNPSFSENGNDAGGTEVRVPEVAPKRRPDES